MSWWKLRERVGWYLFWKIFKTSDLFQVCLGKEKKPRDDFIFETLALKTVFILCWKLNGGPT